MGDLINGRTPEEIKSGLYAHSQETLDCKECPYDGESRMDCSELMCLNALAYIQHLESERDAALAKVPKWIGVEDRLPERHVPVLGLIEKYGSKARINNVVIWDGISWARDTGVYYEDPAGEVTHWMPLPEQPEEEG